MPNKKVQTGLDLSGNKITGLAAPVQSTDAANKAYVDANAAPVQSVNSKTGAVTLVASDITISDVNNNFTTDTVQGAINELFQSANSGKTAIANAIGSPITSADTFSAMANAIDSEKTDIATFINKAEGTAESTEPLAQLTEKLNDVRVFKQRVKLFKTTSSTEQIILNKQVPQDKLVVMPLRLINDGPINPQAFQATFTNSSEDIDDFYPNSNLSFENNRVHIPIVTESPTMSVAHSSTNGTVKQVIINISDKKDFRVTNITNDGLTYQTIANRQILIANGDINLTNVGDLSGFGFDSFPTAQNNGTIPNVLVALRFALSFDSGATWWGKSTDQFGPYVQIQDINSGSNMIRLSILNTNNGPMLPTNQEYQKLNSLRNGSNTLRLAYSIERPDFNTETYFDTMNLYGNLKGNFAPTSNVGVVYNESTSTITCSFTSDDTYQINWIDT